MLSMGLVRSSKVTAKGLVIALAAGLLGTGVVIIGAARPASAAPCGSGSGSFSAGAGTSGDPYLISSAADLIRISSESSAWATNLHYLQTVDINLASCEWTPIGSTAATTFTGVYDGGGYKISGLSINDTSNANKGVGLFGRVSQTTIRNLAVSGTIVSNSFHVGSIVGLVPNGVFTTVTQVTSDVNLTYNGQNYAGGIIGDLQSGSTLSYSSFKGSILATAQYGMVGGLLGTAASTITSSYVIAEFTSSVGPDRDHKAGLIG